MLQSLILIVSGVGGALATFVLQKYGCSAVVASCVVGLIGAGIGYLTSNQDLSLVVFAGSFVGMTSTRIGSLPLMILGGVITALIYQVSTRIFAGFGGRLGTIAFISTLISFYLLLAIQSIFKRKG